MDCGWFRWTGCSISLYNYPSPFRAGSLAFRIYLNYFNSYSATYGSLGAVIILMLWFYITGIAILVGGEINSQIGYAAEESTKREAQLEELKIPVKQDRERIAA